YAESHSSAHPTVGSQFCSKWWSFGAREEIRTPDPQIRSLVFHDCNGEQIRNPIWGGSWGGSSWVATEYRDFTNETWWAREDSNLQPDRYERSAWHQNCCF